MHIILYLYPEISLCFFVKSKTIHNEWFKKEHVQ
jgi:hypothetical protein